MSDLNQSSPAKKNHLPLPFPNDGDENFSSVKKSPMKKHFMSPTISGAAKVNQLSRRKILAERNESLPVKFDPPRATSFNDGFRDENDKECNNSYLITEDSSPIRYNPASNYLSPRPKFLRYKPERRSQIFQRRVELEEEEDVLDLKKDADSEAADISPGNAAAPLSPAKGDEVDGESDDDEFEEELEEDDEGNSVFGRVFRFLLLLMVLAASTVYITSMNNQPFEADYPVGLLKRKEVNGSCSVDYLLAREGVRQPVAAAPSLFLVDVEQKGEEEEEAMELQPSEDMEIQEEEERFINVEEVAEDGIDEVEEEVILHPAAMEVLEEERFMEVEQKGGEEEEAMEEVSEGGIGVEIQEEEKSFIDVEEVTEAEIDGANEEEVLHQEEERFIDAKDEEVATHQNGKSLGAIYAAILASAASLVLVTMTMRKRRNAASWDHADCRSESALVLPPSNYSSAVEEQNAAALISPKTCNSIINNSKNEPNVEELASSQSHSPVVLRQAKSCSTTTSDKKCTSSSIIKKKKKKREEIADAAATTPLRRSTRLATSRGISSP